MSLTIRYARSGDVHIAYQVVGDGPLDLVLVPGWVSNLEAFWDSPPLARFLERLAAFSRLILFDKRGTGLSDRVAERELPTLEQRMDDVRAVLDAVGSERAAVFGYSEGGPLSILFAATHPERTTALACYGTYASRRRSPDYPWAPSREQREGWLRRLESEWGGAADLDDLAPSRAHEPEFRAWWASFLRRSASPGAAVALGRMNTDIDVRDVLPTVRVPTLIVHRTGDRDANVEEGRFVASRIPGARFLELPGDDHLPWIGDADAVVDALQEFLTGGRAAPPSDRILATIVFMDVVDSTGHATRLGDRGWRERLEAVHGVARREVARFRGELVKTLGDGFLATFDGPARATRCACAVRDGVRALGLASRLGVHTGEIERTGTELAGIALHVAARIMDRAGADEVWASSTVRDLVAGSGLRFDDQGTSRLRGTDREWRLFRVEEA